MLRIALIANPGSGSAEEADLDALLGDADGEIEVERFPIERAAEAAECGAERIVVAGGDGSIAPAAEASARAGIELAVIPAGTANDFAARMGLPEDPAEAAKLALGGRRTRAVDLARAGERAFVNVASLGLSPAAADSAEDLKAKLGALAYTVGALRAAGSEQPIGCRVACDGGELFEGEAWQVMIGCTGAFGGGSQIEADADDGQLDAVVIEGGSRAALAKHAMGLRIGSVEKQKGVYSRRCSAVEVELREAGKLNIDGELVGCEELGGERIRFTIEARALSLVIG